METQTLETEIRQERGKGAARQLRARGRIPAVFYGPKAEATPLSVSPKELRTALSTPYGRNVLLELSLSGQKQLAMVKELQVHPVTREVLHVDLYNVDMSRPVQVRVPFQTRGRAKGVVAGGEHNVLFRELPVRATPDKLPSVIEVDVTPMQINEFCKVKDLPLTEGVEVPLDPERNVIALTTARRRAVQEGEGEADAEAAPAAAKPA
jgi:large subunit ribosomal protein L25